MILESRTFSPPALAAYSDFMASLDRATQTRKSSLCTTQFYKNIHISLGSITSSQFVLTPRPPRHKSAVSLSTIPRTTFPDHSRAEFSNFQTKLAAVVSTGDDDDDCKRQRWGRPHRRVNIAPLSEPESGRESPKLLHQYTHFSHYHSRDDAIVRIARAVVCV